MENNAVRKYPSHQLSAPRWRPSSCGLLCTASAALYQECSRLPNTARPVLHHLLTPYPESTKNVCCEQRQLQENVTSGTKSK